jgi:hypothetical protein
VDWVIQQAAERGILIAIVPTWSKFANKGELTVLVRPPAAILGTLHPLGNPRD